jgi:hypothetical protein
MASPHRGILGLAGFAAGSGLGGALTGISALLGTLMPGLSFNIVVLIVAVAAVVGALLAWRLSAAIPDTWIRVVCAAGVVIATAVLGIATVPVQIYGMPGLLGLMLVELIVSLVASQWARKVSGPATPGPGSAANV